MTIIKAASIADWEDEGGALNAFGGALPEGITTKLVREYMVGPYRYTDLSHAISERNRQAQSMAG